MLTIETFHGAPLETNGYLVADVEAGDALLVDAPWKTADQVSARSVALGVTVRLIVCTHGHWDHTMGLPELVAATGAAVACHAGDVALLEHPTFAPFSFPFTLTPVTPDRVLAEGDTIAVGTHRFTVLHTPGHTPGGICLYDEASQILFTGDTLFSGTCGRMDLPGGNPPQMAASLRRLAALPPETRVYPGHGPDTAIGDEEWLAGVDAIIGQGDNA